MKTRVLLLIMILTVTGCSSAFAQDKKDSKKETVLFDVSMTCEKCQKRIEKNIAYEKGVSDMEVSLAAGTVSVTYRKDKTSVEKLQEAFKKLGYTATKHQEKAE